MEHLIRFEIDATRYFVWRQGEWCFEAVVGGVEGEIVNLDLEIPYREAPGIASLQRFPLTSEEGLCLEMERVTGGQDDVTVSVDAVHGSHVMLRFDLPEGVQLRPMGHDAEPAAG
jgi:hypothetical protein